MQCVVVFGSGSVVFTNVFCEGPLLFCGVRPHTALTAMSEPTNPEYYLLSSTMHGAKDLKGCQTNRVAEGECGNETCLQKATLD
jgi:hypothetical protein